MNNKIEYISKDIPALKRENIFRSVFGALFLLVFVGQIVLTIIKKNSSGLSGVNIVVSIFVMLSAAIMVIVSVLYLIKNGRIISDIKKDNSAVRRSPTLMGSEQSSFLKIYDIVTKILTLASVIVLLCSITYSCLQFTYFKTFSFYFPLLLLLCFSGFNSVYHIKAEIHTISSVAKFIPRF